MSTLIPSGAQGDHPGVDGAAVEIEGSEVRLVIYAASPGDAEAIAADLTRQLEAGSIKIDLLDKPKRD